MLTMLRDILPALNKTATKSACETVLKLLTLGSSVLVSTGLSALHGLFSGRPSSSCPLHAEVHPGLLSQSPPPSPGPSGSGHQGAGARLGAGVSSGRDPDSPSPVPEALQLRLRGRDRAPGARPPLRPPPVHRTAVSSIRGQPTTRCTRAFGHFAD